jgi:hypothetical protein
MSSGDEMGSSSRVPVTRRAWVPVVTSCLALNDLAI